MKREGYKLIGTGYNASPGLKAEGIARNATAPKHVIAIMADPEKLKRTILVVPSGTSSFVAPALPLAAGIITYAGTPESHLGIVGREFGLPIIMTLKLEEGNSIPDGTPLFMDCTEKVGHAYAKMGPSDIPAVLT